ncbi:MAG: ion channel [Alphaproteobacteria bacterium]
MAISRKKQRHVRIGRRHFTILGGSRPTVRDLYHDSLAMSWPKFFLAVAAIFVATNFVFAFLYWLGGDVIANTNGGSLAMLFFFSVEALSTVGFGDMHPSTTYGHTVASVENFFGLLFVAVTTGLMFTRFARARARFMFARHPVVTDFNGQPTLMMRVANERHNTVSDASARLWALMDGKSKEGHSFRRFVELKLERVENPVFILSWTIFHKIDESSPLHGVRGGKEVPVSAFILTITGYDENMTQEVKARHWYDPSDIRWDHRYADIIESDPDGSTTLNYDRFHDLEPDGGTESKSSGLI